MGQPTSTVRTPIFDKAGPTVDPHDLLIQQSVKRQYRCKKRCNVHIIACFEVLDVPAFLFGQLLDDEGSNSVSGISLLHIGLEDHTAVDLRRMVALMLACVVRVDGVAHICTDQEGPGDGLCVSLGGGRKALDEQRDEGRLCA